MFRVIIQEVKRPGYEIAPKYGSKCTRCHAEFEVELKECPICEGKRLNKPDPDSYRRALRILEQPNNRRESFGDILGSITKHDLISDDWYLSIEYKPFMIGEQEVLAPTEIRVQDPRWIHPIVDEFGNVGDPKRWFCPVHWHHMENPEFKDSPGGCPQCGLSLLNVAYEQKVNGDITAVWGINQMVRGSTHRMLPAVFGDPRARSLWDIIHALLSMDEWFLDTFRESRLAHIIVFPGYNQAKVTQLLQNLKASRSKLEIFDQRTNSYRSRKGMDKLFLGSDQQVQVHNVAIDPAKIGMLDYYRMAIQSIAGVYGVQVIFISLIEKGKAGTTPAMQIEVQNRTIKEIQRDKEEVINEQLFPIFGVYDWEFKFKELEARDERRDADVQKTIAETVLDYIDAGFDVWFDEFGIMHKSMHPVRDPASMQQTSSPDGDKLSGASGTEINDTSTEREPHGPRPASQQDEERKKEFAPQRLEIVHKVIPPEETSEIVRILETQRRENEEKTIEMQSKIDAISKEAQEEPNPLEEELRKRKLKLLDQLLEEEQEDENI
jgi:hypothetical protein